MCFYYGYTPRQTLDLPLEQFWLLDKSIGRLQASENLERLNIAASSQSQEGYTSSYERYTFDLGTVSKEAPKLDREGLGKLKELHQGPMK